MLLWVLILSVFLSSCGQVCIMGQGECPGYKSETQLTLTASSTLVTQNLSDNVTVTLQINGGRANYSFSASWSTTSLAGFDTNFSGTGDTISTGSTSASLFINRAIAITQQETINITVTDADKKTASVSIKVNPAPSPTF